LITEEIIINFFEGKCNPRDAAIVQEWLKENPEKLKEYIRVEEWEEFQPAHVLSPDISGRLWNNINKDTNSPAAGYSYLRWMAAAASVLLVVGLSWQFLKKERTGIASTFQDAKTKGVFNKALSKMSLILSDGSTVDLSPNSKLSYPEKFNSVKRDVILNGEATFNIAKDAAKPFFVYSNSLLISVLGTRFTVNSYEADNTTKVILHEGRVMVKVPNSSSRDNENEYYLTPGDVFIFKKVNIPSQSTHILHLEKDKDDCYVFNNYPLDVVFDQLQMIYNTKIIYNRAELGNRSFIGKIDKKDPVSHILQSIALLNNFRVHKQGDSCIISN
jgi:ferric-dicitrate binding protein FerR (iron transport regulator)